jgi:hypothetical protein
MITSNVTDSQSYKLNLILQDEYFLYIRFGQYSD